MNLETALAQLESGQLLRRVGADEVTYSFKHALTQDAAYQSLLHQRRREIHRRVAHAYQALYGDQGLDDYAGILAQHYLEAGDDEPALRYATRAGDLAARTYAHAEALAFYTRALDAAKRIQATSAQFIHLYAARGRAYELSEDYPRAVGNYEEMQAFAQARGDRALELESLILQSTAYAVGAGGVRDAQKAQALSLRALALASELDNRQAQAHIYWNLLLNNRFGNEGPFKAIEYGERSLALARELGLTEQIALTLKDLAVAYSMVGRTDKAAANAPEVVALWRQLNNTPMLAEVLGGLSQFYFVQGQLGDSARMGEEAYRLNHSIGNRYGLSVVGSFLWISYREWGEMGRAIELAEESISIAEDLAFPGPAWGALVELGSTFEWLGDSARATEYARRALGHLTPEAAAHPIFPSALLARVALHQGDLAAAEKWLDPFPRVMSGDHFLFNLFGFVQVVSAWIELALAQGDAARALALSDEFMALMDKRGFRCVRPSILHLKAMALEKLNGADDAHALLADARRQAESMETRYRLLPILLTLIEMEIERGDETAAHDAQAQAREAISYVAAHTPAGLRGSFTSQAAVRKVMPAYSGS